MGVVKKKGKAERSDDTEQQSATLEESSGGSKGRGRGTGTRKRPLSGPEVSASH